MNVLVLISHILCILYHLLLNITKETEKAKVPKACHYIKHSLKKRTICVGLNKKIKPDQSLILCSHSIISFTCGGPPGPQSFRALNNRVKGEDKGLCLRRYSSSSSTTKVIGSMFLYWQWMIGKCSLSCFVLLEKYSVNGMNWFLSSDFILTNT